MSKPNLLAFSSSVGIYRNKRIRDLRLAIGKNIHRKVEFRELAPMLFQVAIAYAAENETGGDYTGYTTQDWVDIFRANHIDLDLKETAAVIRSFKESELFDGDKIRSFRLFNRHLADYKSIRAAKERAGKMSAKRRELEAKAALQNGKIFPPEPPQNPQRNGPQNSSPSRQLWLLEKALENAKGKARRELLARKEKLLSGELGVDLSPPAPAPTLPAAKPRKQAPGEFDRAMLNAGRQFLAESPELLTEKMVIALAKAGTRFPEQIYQRFRKVLDGLAEKAGDNPVPG